MIYLTGDTHGDFWSRIIYNDDYDTLLNEGDYLIVLGDFGIWDNSESEHSAFNLISDRHFTTLFIPGNHENYDLLSYYPTETWNGGKVSYIRNNLIYLHRGQVFDIEGKTFFTMGGAKSHDISDGILEHDDPELKRKIAVLIHTERTMFRINHMTWWEAELPTEEELKEGLDNLNRHNNKVDYILSHCPSLSLLDKCQKHTPYPFTDRKDILTQYFDTIESTVEFKHWYFGHLHFDHKIDDKHTCLFKTTVTIDNQSIR